MKYFDVILFQIALNANFYPVSVQLTDELLPVTFLSGSPVFQDILDNVVDNIDTRATTLKTEDVQNIALDLLSYLNIKGYQYNLLIGIILFLNDLSH